MKQLLVTVCLALFMLFSAASAQDLTGKFAITPFGGLGLPVADMADDDPDAVMTGDAGFRKMGIKFGVVGEYVLSPKMAAGLSFRYASFGSKELEIPGMEAFESESKMNAMMFAFHAKYFLMIDQPARPYVVVGAGLAMAQFKGVEGMFYEVEGDLDFDAITKPFVTGGFGANYFVSPNISIFGEATIDYAFTDGSKLEVDGVEYQELGSNYYFVDIIVGLNIWFGGAE